MGNENSLNSNIWDKGERSNSINSINERECVREPNPEPKIKECWWSEVRPRYLDGAEPPINNFQKQPPSDSEIEGDVTVHNEHPESDGEESELDSRISMEVGISNQDLEPLHPIPPQHLDYTQHINPLLDNSLLGGW